MSYLQRRDHKGEVFHHLLELHLEKLRVLIVSHVLLHKQVTKFRRPHLAQRDQGELFQAGPEAVRSQPQDEESGPVTDKLNQEGSRLWGNSTHKEHHGSVFVSEVC